jgi:heme-degrading monooxygenase HmoA
MYARVNYRQIPPGKMDEAVRVYREVTGPDRRAQPGFQQGLILTNRDTGKLIALAFWASETDMKEASPSGHVNAVAGGPPEREEYEVAVQEGESFLGKAGFARVNYHQVPADQMVEVAGFYQKSVLPERKTHQGFLGGLILTNRDQGKMLTISFWNSESDNQAAGPSRLADPLIGPPSAREGYELSAQV